MSGISRRDFLKAGLAAGIAAVVPDNATASIEDIVEKTESYDGRIKARLRLCQNTAIDSDITYFNMHENEKVSVAAARSAVESSGGRLINLEHGGGRYVSFTLDGKNYKFDPNRIFTDNGIKLTLTEQSSYSIEAADEVKRFRDWMLSVVKDSKVMVAVHNNTPGRYSVKYYGDDGQYKNEAIEVHQEPDKDPDDFFLATDKASFDYLKSQKYNVVLQSDSPTDDGSLSVFWARANKGKPYINVEAQEHHSEAQKDMLKVVADKHGNKAHPRSQPSSPQYELYTIGPEDKSLADILRKRFGKVDWSSIQKIVKINNHDDYHFKMYKENFNPNRIVKGRQIYIPK